MKPGPKFIKNRMKNKKRPAVFLDSNVLIAGLVFPRWPYEIIKYGETQEIQTILCPFVIEEVRGRIIKIFPEYLNKVDAFISKGNYQIVPNPSKKEISLFPNLVRDKKDIPIALAAIKAKVDYLVSNDKDLTERDQTTEELRKYIKPLQPGTFLKEVMGWTSEELEMVRYRTWQDI